MLAFKAPLSNKVTCTFLEKMKPFMELENLMRIMEIEGTCK